MQGMRPVSDSIFSSAEWVLSTFLVLSTPINKAAIRSVDCTFGLNSQLSLKKVFCIKSFKKKKKSFQKKLFFFYFFYFLIPYVYSDPGTLSF